MPSDGRNVIIIIFLMLPTKRDSVINTAMKRNLTERMKSKIMALAPDSKSSFVIKNHREMTACYRAAEVLGVKIGRQIDWAGGGWRVIRFN